jgi:hypothetical protein
MFETIQKSKITIISRVMLNAESVSPKEVKFLGKSVYNFSSLAGEIPISTIEELDVDM